MTGLARYRTAAVRIVGLALGAVAILYGGVLEKTPSQTRERVTVVATIGPNVQIGPDALAAAFREGLRCQTLAFASRDPSYFRAQPDHSGDCRGHGPGQAVVYHEVDREFRVVLDIAAYSCPVRGMPTLVQRELGLCPRDRYQYR